MKELAGEAARSWAEQALEELKSKADEWLREQGKERDDG